jgi:hypothetical protein
MCLSFRAQRLLSSLSGVSLTNDSALLSNGLKQWWLLCLPPLRQGRLSQPRAVPDCLSLNSISTRLSTDLARVRVTLRLAVYGQSVHLCTKLLDDHDQRLYFLQLNPYRHSAYVTSCLTRGLVCLLWIRFAFVKCTYRTYSTLLKILPCAQVLCQ